MTQALIFEIGCEDLPALQIDMALAALSAAFVARCKDARISHGTIKSYATPRRLCLHVQELAAEQEDLSVLKIGPALSAAKDGDGNLSPAAMGFLKSLNASADDLEEVEQEKKKGKPALYLAVRVHEKGEKTAKLLPQILIDSLLAIHWAKPMNWGYEPTAFARPVHWIVAVFGREIIHFSFAGIESSNISYGHRFMAPGPITLDANSDYTGLLRKAKVLACIDERRERVMEEAHAAAASVGGRLVENPDLLNEVAQILEWPVGIVGGFDASFLKLPREVLETSMCKHQRYFSLVDGDGNLMPNFVTLSNTEVKDRRVVALGNERVLRARLKDAEFFFAEDKKIPLEQYNEKLKRVRYVEGMGSVFDKSERIVEISEAIAEAWKTPTPLSKENITRAAALSKADLATGMVGEFPELQGIMGSIYAQQGGINNEVSTAIREHYAPRSASDSVAASSVGAIVAVAEKIDSILALFSLGRIPTGTADPFALRRAAVGLLRSLIEHGQGLDLRPIIDKGILAVKKTREKTENDTKIKGILSDEEIIKSVNDFILTRLRYMLSERFASEVVDSVVLNSQLQDIPAIVGRIEALSKQRALPHFEALMTTFKRVANIVRQGQVETNEIQAELFEHEEERSFFESIESIKEKYNRAMQMNEFEEALRLLSSLGAPADRFFDAVLVNSENEAVRRNRYAVLASVEALFRQFADVRSL